MTTPSTAAPPDKVESFIGGAWVGETRGHCLEVLNPATAQPVALLQEADPAEVHRAVINARQAFDAGPWPRMDINERKDILYRIRDRLRAHAGELADLEVLNAGIPHHHVQGQVLRMTRNFEFFAEVASTLRGESYTQSAGFLTWVTREPRGVAALISPWNAPLALSSMRVASCIAFGNTCVLKPSEYTPLAVARMVELMHECGLPPGVVNLVNGRGSMTGEALVSEPGIDMVAFTGGTDTGRRVMASAAARLKPSLLELGGKSANIIHEDADLERALDGALLGIFSNNGLQCLAGSRILVQRRIAEDFIGRFAERTRRIRVGDPMSPDTEVGPLCFQSHLERVLGYVDLARQEGCELLAGGARDWSAGAGFYMQPTALLAPSNSLRACQEEIFGPVAILQVYDSLQEAIALANDSRFGLVCYLWSASLDAAMQVSRSVRAGTIWINTPMMRELRAPFGGYKDSGIGRDGPQSSAEFFTELKTTTVPLDPPPLRPLGRH
ncbi:MAG: aldehyde dehydrogenase [Steroidobacteraceae bacterium]